MTGSKGSSIRLLAVSAAIWIVAVAVAAGLDRYGKASRRVGSVEAVSATALRAVTVESPKGAYEFWKGKGFHGRTALYVAAGWDRINPDDFYVNDPRRHYPMTVYRLADHIEENFLDDRTFLYVAAEQGVARQVVAAVSPDSFGQARESARRAKNAWVTEGSVYVTYQGFPRWFTTVAALPALDEPVLLYVGASAFRDCRPQELLAALRGKGIRSDAVVLCAMAGDPRVTESERRDLAEFDRLLAKGGA